MIWGTRKEDRIPDHDWRTRFAWVPVRLEDGRWLWWDYYHCKAYWKQVRADFNQGFFRVWYTERHPGKQPVYRWSE